MTQKVKRPGGRKPKFAYFVDGKKFDSLSDAAKAFGVTTMCIHNWTSPNKKQKANCWKENIVTELGQIVPKESKHTETIEDTEFFEDAESFLLSVVQGRTFADAARISAARCLIQYQTAKKRLKAETPSPKRLRSKEEAKIEKDNILEFEKKAEKIRKKYKKESK